MSKTTDQSTVAIVLCTYNGAQHLEEQLASLVEQTWPIAVRVFDDGSTDATVDIAKRFADRLDIRIAINDKNLGYVGNFEQGIDAVLKEGFDYIALSDQDDVWHKDRIAKGMQAILPTESKYTTEAAVLSHSDLRMVDENQQCIHNSFLHYRHYEISQTRSLPTVLGQNGVMGNTILMNRSLATMALPFPKELHVHDYWLAVLAELHGHRLFLKETLVDYRLHQANASNSIGGTKFGLARLLENKSWKGLIQRDFRLPFKEDSRSVVVDALLSQAPRFPKLSLVDNHTLTVFKNYLSFNGSRLVNAKAMLKAGFFRKGLRHRTRVVFSTLFTNRYKT